MRRSLANQSDVDALRERLNTVSPADDARWGTMSAAEMVCHLREAFMIAMGEREAAPVDNGFRKPLIKFLALKMPMKWPPNISTIRELQRGAVPAPEVFEDDLAGSVEALERFASTSGNRTPHAIFGAMTHADWMRWGYLHTDHHLRQFGR